MTQNYVDLTLKYLREVEDALKNGYQAAAAELALYAQHFMERYESLRKQSGILENLSELYRDKAEEVSESLYRLVRQYGQKIESNLIGHKPQVDKSHQLATAVITFLALVGLASFIFVSNETTARVVTPSMANFPLGVIFLGILVIGIIIMPHRQRS